MQFIYRHSCPLCGAQGIQPFREGVIDPDSLTSRDFQITDSRYGSLWKFSRCRECGFVFFNPGLAEKDILQFYARLEDKEYSDEAENRSRNFKTVLKRVETLREQYLPSDNRLLDIGAASGIFLHMAQQDGYEIKGVEPSEYLVRDAKAQYDIELFHGVIGQFPDNETFSVITLLDILEHLTDPDAFMARVAALLSENGLLVIVTPDIDSLAARLMGKRWWHYRIAHINFFSLKALLTLLEKHGLKMALRKKYVWHFSLFYLASRFFPSLKTKKTLQKLLKKIHLILPLRDSWEIYACKEKV